jgi:hypothetical protein
VVFSTSTNLRITILVNAIRNKAELPGFSGVSHSSGRVLRRFSALGHLPYLYRLDGDSIQSLGVCLRVPFRDPYLYPHQAEKRDGGRVTPPKPGGGCAFLGTRSNKEMTSQLSSSFSRTAVIGKRLFLAPTFTR